MTKPSTTSLFLLLKVTLFICAFIGTHKLCERCTQGFSATAIDTQIPENPALKTETIDISAYTQQPYTFFGRGGQSYVFLSQDRKTVLKFFKKNHLLPDSAVSIFPQSLRGKHLQTRDERFHTIFQSCKIAYDDLRAKTGLIYLHLNPTPRTHGSITLIDCLGIHHQIDLDQTSFLLQKRGHLMFHKIDYLLDKGDVDGAKRAIYSMISYLKERCRQGIRDNDNALARNYGFIQEEPISIDVGSFSYDESLKDPVNLKKEIVRKTRKLRRWLSKFHPELLSYYDSNLEEKNADF